MRGVSVLAPNRHRHIGATLEVKAGTPEATDRHARLNAEALEQASVDGGLSAQSHPSVAILLPRLPLKVARARPYDEKNPA
jgi:hypothetical protein